MKNVEKRNFYLPKILVIDDQLGRTTEDQNPARAGFCEKFLLRDVSGDAPPDVIPFGEAIAKTVFFRGQKPQNASQGDVVENDLAGCLEMVSSQWFLNPDELPWSLVLLDMTFHTGEVTEESLMAGVPEARDSDIDPKQLFGLRILRELRRYPEFDDLPVIVVTGSQREEIEEEFSKLGALGFISKTAPEEESRDTLRRFVSKNGLLADEDELVIGKSKAILGVLRQARLSIENREPVLIRGSTGTGKEQIWEYIKAQAYSKFQEEHNAWVQTRSGLEPEQPPFIELNVASYQKDLIRSELEGYTKGSHSKADKDKGGLLEQANNGYLFLDEIGEIDTDIQSSLLRIINNNEFMPIGGQTVQTSAKFVFATDKDLEGSVEEGTMLQSFLRRLDRGTRIYIPPLKDRPEDIPLLAKKFFDRANDKFRYGRKTITPEAMNLLQGYGWPSNVGELKSVIERVAHAVSDLTLMQPIFLVGELRQVQTEEVEGTGEQPSVTQSPVSWTPQEIIDQISGFDKQMWSTVDKEALLPVLAELVVSYVLASADEKGAGTSDFNFTGFIRYIDGDVRVNAPGKNPTQEADKVFSKVKKWISLYEELDKQHSAVLKLKKNKRNS